MDLAQSPRQSLGRARALTRRTVLATAVAATASGACAGQPSSAARRIDGIVWQLSRQTLRPRGGWERLGVRRLLVQWSAVDGQSFVEGAGLPLIGPDLPDWYRIASEPWARDVILGLSGLHDEAWSRASLKELAAQSRALALAAAPLPLRVSGWYFPAEVDPTWAGPELLAEALRELPRPLWISAYDSANLGPGALADWIERWLPRDVGVFFQDGVGVHARTPEVARNYLVHLTRRLGPSRVRVIAEAFRPAPNGGFRSATADEFLPQIDAYQAWPIYAFDGPHYLGDERVRELVARGVGPG